jgi:hypothetical protein
MCSMKDNNFYLNAIDFPFVFRYEELIGFLMLSRTSVIFCHCNLFLMVFLSMCYDGEISLVLFQLQRIIFLQLYFLLQVNTLDKSQLFLFVKFAIFYGLGRL